ncbi:MAG: MFS transporter [Candidatus Eisenbacteria bacterium]|uniref:MFS transporter n=1 Tax=Eiseniibacteriota bacterium TaxID=2212470 RepID=A0A938BQD7_UNCEI|nr:MFS transporter [Candidatus Eisenbacteria bacterium]
MSEMPPPAAPPARLLNRHFVLLWQGQFISQIGSELHMVATLFWLKHATGSASLMGVIMMLAMLPAVLLGPVAGAAADRYSRRSTIILTDFARGVTVLSLAAILFLAPQSPRLGVVWIVAVAVVNGTLAAFFRPAIAASVPEIVPRERIASANSLAQAAAQVAVFFGQGMGGVLFRLLGAPLLFLINGVSYLVSGASACFIRIPQRLPEKTGTLRATLVSFGVEILAGLRFIRSQRGMLDVILAATLVNFLLAPFSVLMPFYVEDFLHRPPDWFGFLLAAVGAGALLGYALAGALRLTPRARAWLIVVPLTLIGVSFAALGLTRSSWVALAIMGLIGIETGLINVLLVTILQVTTPTEIRGRVFGVLATLAAGLAPIGMGLAGVIADLAGRNVPLIFLVCGVASTAVMGVLAWRPRFRGFLMREAGG